MLVVFLHALPFDGSMWTDETHGRFDATIAPTLYGLGETLES